MMMHSYEVHDVVRSPADDKDDSYNEDHGGDTTDRSRARSTAVCRSDTTCSTCLVSGGCETMPSR